MGGGDVKMIGAVMLWIPLPLFMPMLMIMAIGGGILSAAMLIPMQFRPSHKVAEVPYGVAIAAAGQIGRAHDSTPVTNALLVCCLLLEKKNNEHTYALTSRSPIIYDQSLC